MVYIERSASTPLDLIDEQKKSSGGKFETKGVWDSLKKVFLDKCYICETYRPTSVEIEHLRPHSVNPKLLLDWNNLFYACKHCNNIKGVIHNNIIDCTDVNCDIDKRIKLIFHDFQKDEVEVISNDFDPQTLDTKELLNKVYNGNTINKKISSSNIRYHLSIEKSTFLNLTDTYQKITNPQKKAGIHALIIESLKRSTAYAAFKRWIIKDDPVLRAEFEKHFD